ncbi:hypothetical protein ABMA09_23545 [Erwinia rhapontici]
MHRARRASPLRLRLYGFTVLRLYGCTVLRLYGCTVVRFYGFTVLRFYGFTVFVGVGHARPAITNGIFLRGLLHFSYNRHKILQKQARLSEFWIYPLHHYLTMLNLHHFAEKVTLFHCLLPPSRPLRHIINNWRDQ